MMGPMTVDDDEYRALGVMLQAFEKVDEFLPAFIRPSTAMKRMSPRALTAGMRFMPKRWPVDSTTGVRPFGAQVVPA